MAKKHGHAVAARVRISISPMVDVVVCRCGAVNTSRLSDSWVELSEWLALSRGK